MDGGTAASAPAFAEERSPAASRTVAANASSALPRRAAPSPASHSAVAKARRPFASALVAAALILCSCLHRAGFLLPLPSARSLPSLFSLGSPPASPPSLLASLLRPFLLLQPTPATPLSNDAAPAEPGAPPWQYEVIMDAGSSGTRVHVYRYRFPEGGVLPEVAPAEPTLKTEPGLSTLVPEQVPEYLAPLLQFAREYVPEGVHKSTPVVLLATAGMRLLPEGQVDSLLTAVREELRRSVFQSEDGWTGMLSGQAEGLYSWLAASYGSGMLHQRLGLDSDDNAESPPGSSGPVALVELGGASAQVTFEHHSVGGCIVHVEGELLGTLNLPGVENSLVTNSFLGFGLDVAKEQVAQLVKTTRASKAVLELADESSGVVQPVVVDPCLPKGYTDAVTGVTGGGNFLACKQLAQKVMQGSCEDHTCTISGMHGPGKSTGSEGVTLPRFRGRILAVENFFYTVSILGLQEEPTLAEVEEAGHRYCSTAWEDLLSRYIETGLVRCEQDLLKYCFSAAYVVVFLQNGLGVEPHERRVHFTNSVKDLQGQEVSVRWALGALIMRATERSKGQASMLEQLQIQLHKLLEGFGKWTGLGGVLSAGEQSRCDPSAGTCEEAVEVVFTCGPEFCCATANMPRPS